MTVLVNRAIRLARRIARYIAKCRSKLSFATKKRAVLFALHQRDYYDEPVQRAYRCVCGRWHLTSQALSGVA